MRPLGLFPALLLLFASVTAGAASGKEPPKGKGPVEVFARYSMAEAACTERESWKFSQRTPEAWRRQLRETPKDRESALKLYVLGYVLRSSGVSAEARTLGEYFMARAIFQMEQIHVAFGLFERVVTGPMVEETSYIKMAALECLQRIRIRYPSLPVSKGVLDGVRGISLRGVARSQVNALTMLALAYFKKNPSDESYGYLRLFVPGSIQEVFAKMVLAAQGEQGAEVLRMGEQFLAMSKKMPKNAVPVTELDTVHIILARTYYTMRDFKRAIVAFQNVRRGSAFFVQSYSDLAWSFLAQKKYNEAVSTAYNLLVGGMSANFAPDAAVIAAIAYFETCHYPEARRALRHFKKNYVPVYQWLAEWANKPAGKHENLYQKAVNDLKWLSSAPKGKALSPVSVFLVPAWVGSAGFLAIQGELNLLLDEVPAQEKLIKSLRGQAATLRNPKDPYKKAYVYLAGYLEFYKKILSDMRVKAVAEIDKDLTDLAEQLLLQVADAAENSQFVEVEVLNAAGTDIINENARPGLKAQAEEAAKAAQKGVKSGTTLDWGKFSETQNGEQEIWEDELGFLKSEVTDICPKP